LAEQAQLHSRLYFKLAYNILNNAHSAEDACQRAFLKGMEQWGRNTQISNLKSWLSRTVINEAFQDLRQKSTFNRHSSGIAAKQSDTAAAPQESTQLDVRLALARLPEPTRTIVALRTMEEMSGNDVAELLDCHASDVSRKYREGLASLRVELENDRSRT